MKRVIWAGLLTLGVLFAVNALAQYKEGFLAVQQANTVPNPDAGDAPDFTKMVPLLQDEGLMLSICADGGVDGDQVLTGGTLRAWKWNAHWNRNERDPDLDLTVGAPGSRCRAFPDFTIRDRGYDWVWWNAVAVTSTLPDAGVTDGGLTIYYRYYINYQH